MAKNFSVRSKELKINGVPNSPTLIKNYLRNKKIRITNTTGGHNYGPIGTLIKIPDIIGNVSGGAGTAYSAISALMPGGNSISFTCFQVIETSTQKDLEDEVKELLKSKRKILDEIENIKDKIRFLKENDLEELDEEQYKSYSVLTLLENKNLSKIKQAKILADLIRG